MISFNQTLHMKTIYFVFLFVILSIETCFSQITYQNYEIGSYIDNDKQFLDGYYDIAYEPENQIKISYTIGEDYTPGYYYDNNNVKNVGLIQFSQNNPNFSFLAYNDPKKKKIKPDLCNSFVIGKDSFTVIKNFNMEMGIGASFQDQKKFVEVIERINNFTIYKHTDFVMNNPVITYLMKKDGTANFISIPKGQSNIKNVLLENFKNIGNLEVKIKGGDYAYDDLESLFKLIKYASKAIESKKVFFDKNWEEIENISEGKFYASPKITTEGNIFLSYYMIDSILIYQGTFTSLYPHKKTGDFTWFYPSGQIRKKARFIENELSGNFTSYF